MKENAIGASKTGTMDLSPPEFSSMLGPSRLSSIPTENRKSFHDLRKTGSRLRFPSVASQTSSHGRQSHGHQSQVDPVLNRGGDMSGDQLGVVQTIARPIEVITELTNEPAPPGVTDTVTGNIPAKFTLPAEAIELDLLEIDGIPALIAGIRRGTMVAEFLEYLEVLLQPNPYR